MAKSKIPQLPAPTASVDREWSEALSDHAKERMLKARLQLQQVEPFWGHLLLNFTYREDRQFQGDMYTDGEVIWYNPQKVLSLRWGECAWKLAALAARCMLLHHTRRNGRDAEVVAIDGSMRIKLWDLAGHVTVWHVLTGLGTYKDIPGRHPLINVPDSVIGDHEDKWKANGWTIEAVYHDLLDDAREQGRTLSPNDPRRNAPEYVDGAVMDSTYGGTERAIEEGRWSQAVQQAAAHARQAGKLPGNLETVIDEPPPSPVDMYALLHEFISVCGGRDDYSWRKPSPYYMAHDMYLPTLYGEEAPPMVIFTDTSGSISKEWLRDFAGILTAVLFDVRPRMTYHLHVDAIVQKPEIYEPGEPIELADFDRLPKQINPIGLENDKNG